MTLILLTSHKLKVSQVNCCVVSKIEVRGKQSNALDKSIKIAAVYKFLSRASLQSSKILNKTVCSKWLHTWSQITLSKTFDILFNTLTGR